jgi:hypothetical protein
MTSADDPELEEVHLEIAELIEQITDQYNQLLEARPQQTHPAPPPPQARSIQ